MKLFDLIDIKPEDIKIHLACYNGKIHPINVYFDGEFDSWQEHQTKRNFERKYILSLIDSRIPNQWLFVGIYSSDGVEKRGEKDFKYKTTLLGHRQDLIGRLVVKYQRKGRASYPYGESIANEAEVFEIKPEPLVFDDFTSVNSRIRIEV